MHGDLLSRHAFQEVLWQDALHRSEERLDEGTHVVQVALLNTPPQTRAVTDKNGKRIQYGEAYRSILMHASVQGQYEGAALERALMHVEGSEPEL